MINSQPSINILGFGHCCIDYLNILDPYPEKGKKGIVKESLIVGGGPVPTALATLAKFGLSTQFIGKIGTDPEGDVIIEGLTEYNVDVSKVIRDKSVSTPRANIWIEPTDGTRTIVLDTTGHEGMKPTELNDRLLENCEFVLCDGRPVDTTLKGLKLAKENCAITVLDIGCVRDKLDEILLLIDYAVVSQDLVDSLCPGFTPNQLSDLLMKMGAKNAVVTCGSDGTVWKSGDEEGHVPAYPAHRTVDTTGAGDIFHGGFIFGLHHGWNIEQSIKLGSAAASISCGKLSGLKSIPTLKEAMSLLDD